MGRTSERLPHLGRGIGGLLTIGLSELADQREGIRAVSFKYTEN